MKKAKKSPVKVKNKIRIKTQGFPKRLKGAKNIAEIFELVKDAVSSTMGHQRAGLMLGLTEIAESEKKFVSGFHPIGSNFIIINKTPLERIMKTNKKLYQAYVFHVLLREYIHTFGILDEDVTRNNVKQISKALFGKEHIVTALSTKFNKFFPYIVYSDVNEEFNQENKGIEMVDNFDSSNVSYLR
ncbi:MAG: metallopeptidase family protein [Candidatus Aenigmatarchaeota archaeon]